MVKFQPPPCGISPLIDLCRTAAVCAARERTGGGATVTKNEQFSKIFSFAAPEGATQFFGGAPLGVPSKNCAKLVFYEIATNTRSVP